MVDMLGYMENNEIWYIWSCYLNMYQDIVSLCDWLGLLMVNDLQMLYIDYFNGVFMIMSGLLVVLGKYWGVGNLVLDVMYLDSQFQYVRFSDNNMLIIKVNIVMVQFCLVKCWDLLIEFIFSDMDVDKGVLVVKKGESLLLIVIVRDGFGMLQFNIVICLG